MSALDYAREIEYLTGHFRRGSPILFCGAGFSMPAKDRDGRALPSGKDLAKELWSLCELGPTYDENSTLQDLYQLALRTKRNQLKEHLTSRLSVDHQTLPGFYNDYYRLPWSRIYTLNVDDLEIAASLRFELPARLLPVSATAPLAQSPDAARPGLGHLEVVHLNGTLEDLPDHVTFSTLQYGERLQSQDPFYVRVVADLITHPVIFIGTQLDEPSLWQHITMRRHKGPRGVMDLRPRSFLVLPHLALPRQRLLQEFNVAWLQLRTEDFAATFLQPIVNSITPEDLEALRMAQARTRGEPAKLPLVSEQAAIHPRAQTEYLMGQEPVWADILTERAIERSVDKELETLSSRCLREAANPMVILVTGTAGSGKTTAIMRLSLHLSNNGHAVAFIDREDDVSPDAILRLFTQTKDLRVIALDDAARFSFSLRSLVSGICASKPGALILLGLRSTRVQRIVGALGVPKKSVHEIVMPPMSDDDIDALIRTLDANNRLGRLKGVSFADRRHAFAEQAGRQLLVAMIQATSGRRFEEKIVEEYQQLESMERVLYCLVATATATGFSLTREELLIAAGEQSNVVLAALNGLLRRWLIVHPRPDQVQLYAARHREIARVVFEHLVAAQQAHEPVGALALAAASMVSRNQSRTSRPWRLLKTFINHAMLQRVANLADCRSIYANLEAILSWDYHFWLQRGALEVQFGDLKLATNFLGQAYSLNDTDPYVITEYAHLRFRLAIDNPRGKDAIENVGAGMEALEKQIEVRGEQDSYPYHVLGSQGLAWTRRGAIGRDERRSLLKKLLDHLEEGVSRHPWSDELRTLHGDLKKEWLMTFAKDS